MTDKLFLKGENVRLLDIIVRRLPTFRHNSPE